jgi:hypothetical protein
MLEDFEILPNPVMQQGLCVGFSKQSPYVYLIEDLNILFAQLQSDGTMLRILSDALTQAAKR